MCQRRTRRQPPSSAGYDRSKTLKPAHLQKALSRRDNLRKDTPCFTHLRRKPVGRHPHEARTSRHSSLRELRCAPAHSTRTGGEDGGRVGANESSGTPRPMPRDPATPTPYGPARRGAALLCWGLSRRGAMRPCGERLGSVEVGGMGRVGWDGCSATPPWLWPARRGAALLCWGMDCARLFELACLRHICTLPRAHSPRQDNALCAPRRAVRLARF